MYTKEDVLEDICQHEGVKVIIDRPFCAIVLYSDKFPRTKGNKTVDDLKKKIDEYLNKYCVQPLDIEPVNDEEIITLYSGTLGEGVYTKLGSIARNDPNGVEKFQKVLNNVSDDQKHCILLDHEGQLVRHYNRILH